MDRDRIEGRGKQIKGKVREGFGKMTDDTSEQLKGKAENLSGKVQEGYGKIKDDVRAERQKGEERREAQRPRDEDEL